MLFADLRRALASWLNRPLSARDSALLGGLADSSRKLLERRVRPLAEPLVEAERVRFEEAMFTVRQQLDAVELLSSVPHRAESIHVLTRALHTLEEALAHLRRALPDPVLVVDLLPDALGLSLQALRERLEATPRLDVRLSQADLRCSRMALRLARRLCSPLLTLARGRRTTSARRTAVFALALAPLAVSLAAWLAYWHLRDTFSVAASAYFGSERATSPFYPEQAVDGNWATEWLAPDDSEGWFELRFFSHTQVTSISIINARNAPFNDRGTQALQIQLYRGSELAQQVEVTLAAATAAEAAQTIPIHGTGITRVRLIARSHYGRGAGFAEVHVIANQR
ncbi:MAG TPA: hypothetical protein VGC79_15435 [Polyangiaceae bacterium]